MEEFYGTKRIRAFPMDRQAYNDYRGWELPADENGDDAGYLVEYLDGGASNHPKHTGYVSWSPKEPFEKAYKPITSMTFGHALEALKEGRKVARAGWNGADMFLYLVPGSEFKVNRAPLLGIYPEGHSISYRPHIDLKTADGSVATWSPSGSDALAEDWLIVE